MQCIKHIQAESQLHRQELADAVSDRLHLAVPDKEVKQIAHHKSFFQAQPYLMLHTREQLKVGLLR